MSLEMTFERKEKKERKKQLADKGFGKMKFRDVFLLLWVPVDLHRIVQMLLASVKMHIQ